MINEKALVVTPELEKVINELVTETGGRERLRGSDAKPFLQDNNEESKEIPKEDLKVLKAVP